MPRTFPTVSIIVPAYNAAPHLAETLDSVLDQSWTDFELLVVDDGSSDETAAIAARYAASDRRIRLLRQPNRGVAAARNAGIDAACGRYIAPLDADDIWLPRKLARQVHCLERAEADVGMAYAWSLHMDLHGRLTGGYNASPLRGDLSLALLYVNVVGHASAPLIRRDCLEQVGGYSPEFHAVGGQGCEDLDLYLRIAERFLIELVPEFLVGYRRHDGSMSQVSVSMERGHRLALERAAARRPIPRYVVRWARSRYQWCLHNQCAARGEHRAALRHLGKALLWDLSWLTDRRVYRGAAANLVRWAVGSRRVSTPRAGRPDGPHWRQADARALNPPVSHRGRHARRLRRLARIGRCAPPRPNIWLERLPRRSRALGVDRG